MPCNLYEAAWIFMVYAFIGWCAEVAYAGLDKGVFVNRRFLNGSCCPIYGLGMLIVISLLTPIKDNFVLLFWEPFADDDSGIYYRLDTGEGIRK